MALDGPYTLDDLYLMTGTRQKKLKHLLSKQFTLARKSEKGTQRLLGIDPGTRFVGWGLIERTSADCSLRLVDYGCIAPDAKLPLHHRLCHIFTELEEMLKRTRPVAAALEETFAGVNMKSALSMGHGRGIALLCLARANLDILELSPRSIKQAVTGSGASGKTHVAAMVAAHLHLPKVNASEHVSDALAAAIALARRF